MNRRELIATLSGLPFVLKAAAIASVHAPLGYGLVDVERHLMLRNKGIWLRAMFNGVDVTNRCREADDKTGRVCLYKQDWEGRPYLDYGTMDVAKEELYGEVRFVRAEPWA